MERALDQLRRLIDSAAFGYRSMPERIDTLDDQDHFREWQEDFERDLERNLEIPDFPPQKVPDILRTVHSRIRRTEIQVKRLRFQNSYPSAGARERQWERTSSFYEEAMEALDQARRELLGQIPTIRSPDG